MNPTYTYRIVEAIVPPAPGKRAWEVWGRNADTGYEWLIGEYNTRNEARRMIRHWQETAV